MAADAELSRRLAQAIVREARANPDDLTWIRAQTDREVVNHVARAIGAKLLLLRRDAVKTSDHDIAKINPYDVVREIRRLLR